MTPLRPPHSPPQFLKEGGVTSSVSFDPEVYGDFGYEQPREMYGPRNVVLWSKVGVVPVKKKTSSPLTPSVSMSLNGYNISTGHRLDPVPGPDRQKRDKWGDRGRDRNRTRRKRTQPRTREYTFSNRSSLVRSLSPYLRYWRVREECKGRKGS